jgi:hypothetical protein
MSYLNDFKRMAVGRELPKLNEGVEHDDFSRALVNGVRAARGLPATPAAEAAQKRDFQSIMADIEQTTSDISKKKLTVKAGKAKLDALWREMAAVQGALPESRLSESRLAEAEDADIAMTIVQQMGGRMKAMLGATLTAVPKGLKIKWPQKQRSLGNVCVVTLRPDDTYDMEFFNGAKSVKKFEGLYAEDLKPTFEKHTGWYLSL